MANKAPTPKSIVAFKDAYLIGVRQSDLKLECTSDNTQWETGKSTYEVK